MREEVKKHPVSDRKPSLEGFNINPVTPINIIPQRAPASPPPPPAPRRPRQTVSTD